jgi:hypothetical protein
VQETAFHQVLDGLSFFESGVELDQRVGPQFFIVQFIFHEPEKQRILDIQKAVDVASVIVNQLLMKFKYVHQVRPFINNTGQIPARWPKP